MVIESNKNISYKNTLEMNRYGIKGVFIDFIDYSFLIISFNETSNS